jgi:hypothetical protein
MLAELNASNAWVFRVMHVKNVPWILDHGLHCRNSKVVDPNFVQIGNADLINSRRYRNMKGPYAGTLEIACCDATSAASLQEELTKRNLNLKVTTKSDWYF